MVLVAVGVAMGVFLLRAASGAPTGRGAGGAHQRRTAAIAALAMWIGLGAAIDAGTARSLLLAVGRRGSGDAARLALGRELHVRRMTRRVADATGLPLPGP